MRCLARFVVLGLLPFGNPLQAEAQNVLQAHAMFQPLSYQDQSGYNGCGIRVVMTSPVPPSGVEGADISLNLSTRSGPLALLKVGSFVGTRPELAAIRTIPIHSFSLARQSDGKPVSLSAPHPSDDKHYLLAAVGMADALDVLTAMMSGEKILLSIVRKKGERAHIYAFRGALEREDGETFDACLGAIIPQIEKSVK
jgi:hypothetical protein